MDASCLEKVNKDSKVWQHGKMVALDWLQFEQGLFTFFTCMCVQLLYISVSRHQIKKCHLCNLVAANRGSRHVDVCFHAG